MSLLPTGVVDIGGKVRRPEQQCHIYHYHRKHYWLTAPHLPLTIGITSSISESQFSLLFQEQQAWKKPAWKNADLAPLVQERTTSF
jgi:hypothetical protein